MNLKEFGLYFAEIREKSGYRSQRELSDKSGVSHSTINRIEAGTHKVSVETLQKIAPHLKNVTYSDLLRKAGYIDDHDQFWEKAGLHLEDKIPYPFQKENDLINKYYELNPEQKMIDDAKLKDALKPKEERDIARDLEKLMSDLDSDNALAFQGEPMSEEDRELLKISLENSLRLAKQIAKKKFTPNKYKK